VHYTGIRRWAWPNCWLTTPIASRRPTPHSSRHRMLVLARWRQLWPWRRLLALPIMRRRLPLFNRSVSSQRALCSALDASRQLT
jgi:hypothetical protein